MSAEIHMNKARLGGDFVKQTAKYIAGGFSSYFTEAMPNTTSTIAEAKATVAQVKSTLSSTTQSVTPIIRRMRTQASFRNLSKWYLQKEDEYDTSSAGEIEFNPDDGITDETGSAEIAVMQMSETQQSANQISKAVIEAAHHQTESQISTTANIIDTLTSQTAAITAGFDRTNSTLEKILEVLTKNTSSLIEVTAATGGAITGMGSNGKFNLNNYKKMVTQNLKNSPMGMGLGFASILTDPGMMKQVFTPQNLIGMAMNGLINKKAPNLQKNLKAFDDIVSDTILSSLIRISESNKSVLGVNIGKIFGIDASRKTFSGARSELGLKAVPFDSVTKEAITGAIPGYLRKILVAVGGPDLEYDYRSRSFKSKGAVKRDFRAASATTGTAYGISNSSVRAGFTADSFGNMSYDLLINDLINNLNSGRARDMISKLSDPKYGEKYLSQLVGGRLNQADKLRIKQLAALLSSMDAISKQEMYLQAARASVNRNQRMQTFISEADMYGRDLSGVRDSATGDAKYIKEQYGRSSVRRGMGTSNLSGIDYSNMALYEIYRLLDRGINVFQTGSDNSRSVPYKMMKALKAPAQYRPPNQQSDSRSRGSNRPRNSQYDGNPLTGPGTENMTPGERASSWGRRRGSQFVGAMFNGSADDVRAVVSDTMRDVSGLAGAEIQKGLANLNQKFGNITGYLQHKIFGGEYSYVEEDENGKKVLKTIGKNEKGGLFGFVADNVKETFSAGKDKAKKWFQDVAGYFDYGDKNEEDKSLPGKRKKLLASAVGAFAGAGILGGPIGLLVGAVAGNALSATGIGQKLKEKLLGHDKETGKPTGLLTKAFDKIVTPFQYQAAKTLHAAGNVLKKNIIGPLSDIGFAIKERVSNAAHSAFSKFFGGIINGAKKVGGGLLKLGGKMLGGLFGVSAEARGMKDRAMMEGVTWLPGKAMSVTARLLAGSKEGREKVKQRQKERNAAIKEDKFMSKDEFRQGKYDRTKNNMARIESYTQETVTAVKDVEDVNKDIEKNTSKAVDVLKDIRERLSNGGMSGGNSGRSLASRISSLGTTDTGPEDDHGFISGAVAAASNAVMSSDSVSTTEERDISGVMSEASKKDPNKKSILSKVTGIFRKQKGEKKEEGEKKESIFSKILNGLGGILDHLPEIALAVAGIWMFLKDPDGVFAKIKGALGSIAELLGVKPQHYDDATTGANVVTQAIGDFKAKTLAAYATPMNLYHAQDDASGEEIVNHGATQAKNEILYGHNAKSWIRRTFIGDSLTLPGGFTIQEHTVPELMQIRAANKYFKTASKLGNQAETLMQSADDLAQGNFFQRMLGRIQGARASHKAKEANEVLDNYYEQQALADQSPGRRTLNGIGHAAAKVGTMYGVTNLAGWGAGQIAKKLGASEEVQDRVDTVVTGATAAAITVNEGVSSLTGKKSFLDKILDGLKELFKVIKEKLTKNKTLEKFGKEAIEEAVTNYGDDAIRAVGKVSEETTEAMAVKAAEATGKEAAGAYTLGIAVAVGALDGAVSGFCGVEHLFGVLPGEADGWMKTTATIVEAIWHALEWVPVVGIVISVLDIIDGILESVIGIGIRQWLVRAIYTGFGFFKNNKEKLDKLQDSFHSEVQYYNEKYGASLNDSAFNDLVNNTGWVTALWNGATKKDAEGHVIFNEAGGKQIGGLHHAFEANKDYLNDAEGNVIKDEKGDAIVQVDAYGNAQTAAKLDKQGNVVKDEQGNVVKEGRRIHDYVKMGLNGAGHFLFGGDVYETDDQGNAIWDPETNSWKVARHDDNVVVREWNAAKAKAAWAKDKLMDAGAWVGNKLGQAKDWAGDKLSAAKDWAVDKLNAAKDWAGDRVNDVKSGFKAAGDWLGDKADAVASFLGFGKKDKEKGEISEETKSKLKSSIGSIGGKIGDIANNLLKTVKGVDDEEITDENGAKVKDDSGKSIKLKEIGKVAKSALSNIGKSATKTIGKITDGIKGFFNKDEELTDADGKKVEGAELGEDGKIKKVGLKLKDLGSFVKKGIGGIFSTITKPISTITDSVAKWEESDSPWAKKFKSAKDWMKDKLSKTGSFLAGVFGNLPGSDDENGTSFNDSTGGNSLWSRLFGTGGPVSDMATSAMMTAAGTAGTAATNAVDATAAATQQEPGGNPLNKTFKITSGFGVTAGRPHSGAHKGIDIVPSDGSGDAEVGSRFQGTVTKVVSNVPDSMHAVKQGGQWVFPGTTAQQTGNMVVITTDDGLVVKNMHLKAGSIPSNIQEGARVNIGDLLGKMGTTGWSTGPHLHYEFRENDQPIDPTESATNGAQMSSFSTTANGTYPASAGIESMSTDGATTSTASGPLGKLGEALRNLGNAFLNKLTGGLVGSDSSSSTTVDTSGSVANIDFGSVFSGNGGSALGGSSKWLTIVRDIKRLVAIQHPQYNQSGYIYIDYMGKHIRTRTDCTGIIATMLKCYGAIDDNKNINSAALLNNGCITNGFTMQPWPGWDKLVEGDIMAVSGHAEIFARNEGNKHFVYNGGSTSALCSADATPSSHKQYSVIWRCKEPVSTSASDVSAANITVGEGAQGIWNYLKGQGLSDYAVAGIMGNLYAESGLRANNLQNSYEGKLGSDDAYTQSVNSGRYTNFSNDSAGYGLAQWTSSGRKDKLFKATVAQGKRIDDTGAQLGYLMDELRSSYKKTVLDPISSASSVKSASDTVLHKFEAPANQSSSVENTRASYGKKFYDEFASTTQMAQQENTDFTEGVGGPVNATLGDNTYSTRSTGSGTSTNRKSSNIIPFPGTSSSASGGVTSQGNQAIVDLLYRILTTLNAIQGNTGTSNSYLSNISQNGIQDKELRGAFSSIKGGQSSNNTRYSNPNPNNTRMVNSLARP